MAATPLVTAIVSTYRSERFIGGCLEDLLAQTVADQLEIIVIDSGSPERESEIVRKFQKRKDITLLRTERETVYKAWNRAIALATGRYLTNANTDDRHHPAAYERLVAALERSPTAALAYADASVTVETNQPFDKATPVATFRWPEFDRITLFKTNFVGPQPMWRRELHDRFGVFDEHFVTAGDYEFWLRLAQTESFVHLPEVLGLYLLSSQSIEHRNKSTDRDEAEVARRRYWRDEWGERPAPGGYFLCWNHAALGKMLLHGRFQSLLSIARMVI